jgi:CheY-like chemotaxis protein/HPt (histidine-containing phosphotransfer) domain-containing protein
MIESKDFRLALLSGGAVAMCDAVTPLLLAHSDCFLVVETVDELLSLAADSKPEIIFICHQPGTHDGIAAVEQIRELFILTPKVILADKMIEPLEAALAVGACAVLEPPFSKETFLPVFNNCCQIVRALRWEALKQQQNRIISELFTRTPFCQLFVNVDGIVTYYNNAAADIVGIGTNTVVRFTELSRRFFVPHAATYPLELETAVQTVTSWNGILSGRLADSSVRIYRAICVPLQLADGVLGVLITLNDLSAEQAEQANLRIALQAAQDCLTLAAEGEITAELLKLSNPGFQLQLAQENFSLRMLLNSLKGTAELTIPDYLPENFCGDTKHLDYLIRSMVNGCRRFGGGAPQVSLSIKERTPVITTLQFNFSVENTHIPSDSYQSIDDYLETACLVPYATDGLGLTAVLVKKMGGTLMIRTVRGVSRTVSCFVPLKSGVGDSAPDSPTSCIPVLDSPPVAPPLFKVLLAEDNLLEQATLKHLLEDIGCQTIVVSDGKEAIDEYENGEFDVVLMDILMPVMDGFEATRLIRERERITGGTIPVVALTSYSLKAIQEKCASVGMDGYLAKPVAKEKLMEKLQQISRVRDASGPFASIQSDLSTIPLLDTHEVLDNIGFEIEFYKEMVEMYLTTFAGQGNELAAKLAGEDLKDILECAHSLKGTLSNIGGKRLAEVARQIQDMCNNGKKPDSTVWVPIVEAQTAAIKEALEQIDWDDLTRFVADK